MPVASQKRRAAASATCPVAVAMSRTFDPGRSSTASTSVSASGTVIQATFA